MLVHGFPQHWWSWRGVAGALDGKAHLVLPDLRGSGWSVVPGEKDDFSKRAMADDLALLLDALGISDIAVAGHDWGGFTTQLLALRHPERVRALLSLSIPPVIPTPRPPLRSLARMYYQLVFSAPGSTRFFQMSRRFAGGMRQDVRKKDAFTAAQAAIFAAPYRDPARARAAQLMYRSFVTGDAAATFKETKGKRFSMPVRFVLSAYDAYIPPQFAEHAGMTGDSVTAEVQDRTGHFVVDEDPAYVAGLIEEWLLPQAAPLGA